MNYFETLAKNRQSCREFNDKPLSKETVMQIVQTALLAPSACNSQPWKLYVVTDSQVLPKVTDALTDRGHNKFLSGAKAYIAVCEKDAVLKESAQAKFGKSHFVKYDIGEIVAYLTLAAEDLGVSSCIIGWVNGQKIEQAINLSEGNICNLVVALGYSDIPKRNKVRKAIEQTVIEL